MWFGKLTVFTSFKVSVSVFRSLEMVSNINTFVFFDIETSGLDRVRDRITEVSLQAVLVKDFLKTAEEALGPVSVDQPAAIETNNRGKKLPRILFKTRFCVNPTKFIRHEASLVSGLYNDMLNDLPMFGEAHYNAIVNVFHQTVGPWCLVAHNGNKFDFPILKAEFDRLQKILPNDVFCLDSLVALREIDSSWLAPPASEEPPPNVLAQSNDPGDSTPFQTPQKSEKVFVYSPTAKQMIPQLASVRFVTPPGVVTQPPSSPLANGSPVLNSSNQSAPPPARRNLFNTADGRTQKVNLKMEENSDITSDDKVPAYQRVLASANVQRSYNLKSTFLRLFPNVSGDDLQFHTAEDDVEALLRVCREYGNEFVRFAEEKSVPFTNLFSKGI